MCLKEFEKNSTNYIESLQLNKYPSARFSLLFIKQLWLMDKANVIPSCYVMDAIKEMEGVGKSFKTKKAEPFNHPPLAGFMHKHFFAPQFLYQNLSNYIGIEAGHFSNHKKIIQEVKNKYDTVLFTEEMSYEIAHKVSVEAIHKRMSGNRITGEWIIYKQTESIRYYLSVASHNEDEQLIYNRIQNYCCGQFPFLFIKI